MKRAGGPGWITAAATMLALACAGCGFKGPLYLPARNPTVVTHPGQAAQGAQPPGQTQSPAQTQASAAKGKGKASSTAPQNPPPASPPSSPP